MIKILNQSRQPVAILENAFDIGYSKRLNEVWGASFTLPLDDPKNAECKPLNYVEVIDDLTGENIGLFRIVPSLTKKDESANVITYECDHVLSTLLDSVLFGYNQTTNLTTKATIEFLLNKQNVKHWKLGRCDFTRYFSYKWENENGLLAPLFSVTEPFDVPVEWTFDTSSYPWTLNLVAPSRNVTCEVRYGKNQRGIERQIDPTNIVNRIYPIGAGEGVNALNITSVNGGKHYLENTSSINTYGLLSYVWVDRRFENAESLKASAQALLNEWSTPKVTYRVSAVDLSIITGVDADKLRCGRVVRLIDPDIGIVEARIVSEIKNDIVGAPGDVQLEIANKTEDLGTTQADIQRRQQVNELYSQGATNIDSDSFADNCDATHPAVIRFWIPDDVVNINTLDLTFEAVRFRAYSKAAKTTSSTVTTTSSGGGSTVTSSSGGGTTVTSSSGGGVSTTSGFTAPTFFLYSSIHLPNQDYASHTHAVEVTDELNHAHTVSISPHQHSVSISPHSHTVETPSHTHSLTLAGHGHELIYGIWEEPTLPTSVTIKVDGNTVPGSAISGENINLIPYLAKETDGRVKRGWHTITLTPDGLARINAQLVRRVFIQSHSGGNY